jgi:hypothetical protein
VLQDHGIAQATPDSKAIWKTTVTNDADWSNTFTFLKLAPSLIWEAGERPAPFAGTVRVEQAAAPDAASVLDDAVVVASTAIDAPISSPRATPPPPSTIDRVDPLLGLLGTANEQMQTAVEATPRLTPAMSVETAGDALALAAAATNTTAIVEGQVSGEHFMAWLKHSIQTHRLIINDAKALVHTVADTVYLVSPGVFQRYAQEHPQTAYLAKQDKVTDWQWAQKRFEKLHLHRKQRNGLNIWTCEVTGPRKCRRLHGYLLQDPHQLFADLPPNNPYLSIVP